MGETDYIPARDFAIRRVGWGLLVGTLVSTLPYVVAKIGSDFLVPLFVLLWPGEFVGMAIGGWNARPFTVFLIVLTNAAFYTGVTYVVLTRVERWRARRKTGGREKRKANRL